MTEQNQFPGTAGEDDTEGHMHHWDTEGTVSPETAGGDDTQGHMRPKSDDRRADDAEDDVTGHKRPD